MKMKMKMKMQKWGGSSNGDEREYKTRKYLNISDIVYHFIDSNVFMFNLDKITEDHSIDTECLNHYIDYQKTNKRTEPFWNFYKYLYDNIMYISNSRITKQYELGFRYHVEIDVLP